MFIIQFLNFVIFGILFGIFEGFNLVIWGLFGIERIFFFV